MYTTRRLASETEIDGGDINTSRFRHITEQLVGKGKKAWLCAYLGAWQCSRRGRASAQHLQDSGTKAEHTV
jgi:hypothetical protein